MMSLLGFLILLGTLLNAHLVPASVAERPQSYASNSQPFRIGSKTFSSLSAAYFSLNRGNATIEVIPDEIVSMIGDFDVIFQHPVTIRSATAGKMATLRFPPNKGFPSIAAFGGVVTLENLRLVNLGAPSFVRGGLRLRNCEVMYGQALSSFAVRDFGWLDWHRVKLQFAPRLDFEGAIPRASMLSQVHFLNMPAQAVSITAFLVAEADRDARDMEMGRVVGPRKRPEGDALLTCTRCRFENCTSSGDGGAVEIKVTNQVQSVNASSTILRAVQRPLDEISRIVEFERCRLIGNSAKEHGGAIRVSGPVKLLLSSSMFSGNSARSSGGAVSASLPLLSFLRFKVTQGSSSNTSVLFRLNEADIGGALAIASRSDPSEWSSLIFESNHARSSTFGGGAVWLRSLKESHNVREKEEVRLLLSDTAFLDNTSAGSGGAWMAYGGCALSSHVAGHAKAFRRDISAFRTPITTPSDACPLRVLFADSTFQGNRAKKAGGAIRTDRPLIFSGCNVTHNIAEGGAGGAVSSPFLIKSVDSDFVMNAAQKGLGGALALFGSGADIHNSHFIKNMAFNGGGALAVSERKDGSGKIEIASHSSLYSHNVAFHGDRSAAGAVHIVSDGAAFLSSHDRFEGNGGLKSGAISMVSGSRIARETRASVTRSSNPSEVLQGVLRVDGSAFALNGPYKYTAAMDSPSQQAAESTSVDGWKITRTQYPEGPDIFLAAPLHQEWDGAEFLPPIEEAEGCQSGKSYAPHRPSLIELCHGDATDTTSGATEEVRVERSSDFLGCVECPFSRVTCGDKTVQSCIPRSHLEFHSSDSRAGSGLATSGKTLRAPRSNGARAATER